MVQKCETTMSRKPGLKISTTINNTLNWNAEETEIKMCTNRIWTGSLEKCKEKSAQVSATLMTLWNEIFGNLEGIWRFWYKSQNILRKKKVKYNYICDILYFFPCKLKILIIFVIYIFLNHLGIYCNFFNKMTFYLAVCMCVCVCVWLMQGYIFDNSSRFIIKVKIVLFSEIRMDIIFLSDVS